MPSKGCSAIDDDDDESSLRQSCLESAPPGDIKNGDCAFSRAGTETV